MRNRAVIPVAISAVLAAILLYVGYTRMAPGPGVTPAPTESAPVNTPPAQSAASPEAKNLPTPPEVQGSTPMPTVDTPQFDTQAPNSEPPSLGGQASLPAPSQPKFPLPDAPKVSDASKLPAPNSPVFPTAEASVTGASLRLAPPLPNMKVKDVLDTFNDARSGARKHEATDILAPRGTPIRAVAEGVVKKLFLSKAGGKTVYQFDPAGQYCFYYAHLDRYADNLKEGQAVHQGDVLGYVGTTGDAPPDTPHLHFAIFKLGPEKNWWQGTPLNPYPYLHSAVR